MDTNLPGAFILNEDETMPYPGDDGVHDAGGELSDGGEAVSHADKASPSRGCALPPGQNARFSAGGTRHPAGR
jgi:hypothetical protein